MINIVTINANHGGYIPPLSSDQRSIGLGTTHKYLSERLESVVPPIDLYLTIVHNIGTFYISITMVFCSRMSLLNSINLIS